jgi:hypothetical protein
MSRHSRNEKTPLTSLFSLNEDLAQNVKAAAKRALRLERDQNAKRK